MKVFFEFLNFFKTLNLQKRISLKTLKVLKFLLILRFVLNYLNISGFEESKFEYDKKTCRVFSVQGQKNEKRNWINCKKFKI
jgi:hypothetical protein